MSQLQESFWRSKEKRQKDKNAVHKAQFKRKRKRNEKRHAARFETVWQERQDLRSWCGVNRRSGSYNYNLPKGKSAAMQTLWPE